MWLKPRSTWRANYEDWPVIKKLEYVAELMEEMREQKPAVVSREHVDPVRTMQDQLGRTLRPQARTIRHESAQLVRSITCGKLFSDLPEHADALPAATFLRTQSGGTSQDGGPLDGRISIHDRSGARGDDRPVRGTRTCGWTVPLDQAKRDALVLVTVQTMNYLHGGHHRVAL